jgi:hypothetical protein
MKDSTKEKVKKLTDQLETGVKDVFSSDRYAEYLKVMSRFHRYSANNCMLIAMQKPCASYVAGYRTWEKMDRHVNKGEKAITILAPIQRKWSREVVNDDGATETEEHKYYSYMPVSVFDISQTAGKDMPSIMETLTGGVEDGLLEKIRAISPVPVIEEDIEGGANGYYHHDGYIAVKRGLSGMQTAKTLLHEISHALLHSKEGEEADADRNTKEVQAESTAYVVCNYLGLDTSDYSFGYVATWSSGKAVKELQQSLEVIRKTASDIIEMLSNIGGKAICA